MQQRRGTSNQWASANPILNEGEIGWESDTNQFKIGDGTNHWGNLSYFIDETSLNTSLGDYVETSLLGVANGVATLNSSGKLESSQVPNIDELAQDAVDSALVAGTGISKTYNDNSNTITLAVDTTTIQARVTDVSDTEIGYLANVTSDIQTQINAKASSTDLAAKASLSGATFTGNVVVQQNLQVDGNFTVNGSNVLVSATQIQIEDSILQLAHENVANTVDLGLVAGYNDGSTKHAGLVKDATDSKWKLFKNVTDEPTTTVNFAQATFDDLVVGGLEATTLTVGNVSNTEFSYLDGVTSAIQTQLDAKATTSALASHESDTTNIHGIANTAVLVTLSGSETLTNKTINGANNTLTVRLANDVSGTLPVANGGTGITSLGTGVATFLGTPSSANLASAITDETGSGSLVFATSPTLVTPNLGTPTALNLTNATSLPVSGITSSTTQALGLGTIELGHASDTTIARSAAGVITVEGVVVPTISSTNTLTNKTVSLTNNTLSGTLAEFNTALSDGDFATLAGTETLTNKTITGLIYTQTILTPTFTTNAYTLVLGDQGDILLASNGATAGTVNVPLNSTVAFPTGTQITVVQTGAGQISFAGISGVTVNATPGLKLRAQYSAATLIKTDTNSWLLIGDLSE
jgi:hypothetical protein